MAIERVLIKGGLRISIEADKEIIDKLKQQGYKEESKMSDAQPNKIKVLKNEEKKAIARELKKYLQEKGYQGPQLRKIAATFYSYMLKDRE